MPFWFSQNGNYCSKNSVCKVAKLIPKRVIYRDYKNFNRDKFKRELEGKINKNSNLIGEYDYFEKTFLLVLNKYAPIKAKLLKLSHVTYNDQNSKKGNHETSRARN